MMIVMRKPVAMTRGKLGLIIAGLFASAIISTVAGVNAAERGIDASNRAGRDALVPVCQYLAAQHDVFRETPPESPTGMKLAQSVDELLIRFDCKNITP